VSCSRPSLNAHEGRHRSDYANDEQRGHEEKDAVSYFDICEASNLTLVITVSGGGPQALRSIARIITLEIT